VNTTIDTLPTPCLILDQAKFQHNVTKMRTRIAQRGGTLRLHVKTNKSIDATRRIIADGAPERIMVSTLEEARYFAAHGLRDITYGVGIVDQKLEETARLIGTGVDLKLVLDSAHMARRLGQRGRELGVTFKAYVEIDTDGHRAGLQPQDAQLIEIGRILAGDRGSQLAGVITHAGGSYECRSIPQIRAMAEQERSRLVVAAEHLRAAGIACPQTSLGSTPTATFGESLAGITEVRAGVYVFQDLVMAGLEVCRIEDIALSVLATVIGHQTTRNWLITDGGWMALSRDRGTAQQAVDQGYGVVCDVDGRAYGDLVVTSANQEHGIVADRHGGAIDFERFPIGTQVRVLPNHACATAAQHDRYHVVEGRQVKAVWPRINHW
jgi:D-serine deaminase-like pyridoxal phosphate-dependent protein